MNQWECKIRLRFGLFKRTVIFTFEWGAWFMAYEKMNCSPDEFNNLPIEDQIMAISYGAAAWSRIKRKKRIFFSYDQLSSALMRASRAENMRIGEAMNMLNARTG